MDAIEFVNNYLEYVNELSSVVKDEYQPVIKYMRGTDPHDLVTPDGYFSNSNQSKGFVWSYFMFTKKLMDAMSGLSMES